MEVLSLLSDDVETDDATPGENLKLRLKGIEEEEILPGFILCNAENLCHSGRTFDAQVGAPTKYSLPLLRLEGIFSTEATESVGLPLLMRPL